MWGTGGKIEVLDKRVILFTVVLTEKMERMLVWRREIEVADTDTDFPRITEPMFSDTFHNSESKDTLFSSRSDYRLHGTSTVFLFSPPSEEGVEKERDFFPGEENWFCGCRRRRRGS